MDEQQNKITPELIQEITALSKEMVTAEHNVKNLTTFDEFMDWVDIDIGLSKELMLKAYLSAEEEFRDKGYLTRANLIRIKYEKIKNG